MNDVRVLAQAVMTVREAARQLRIPPSTLTYWLEGDGQRDPILRDEPTGSADMTWGEIVEARYLRAYRRHVPMQQLRLFLAELRQRFEVQYPLAYFKPFIGPGQRLLLEVQDTVELPDELRAVYEVKSGELVYAPVTVDFLERVDFAEGGDREAERIHPAGRRSPVVMDPRISSGAPTVRGIRTEIIAELVDADTPVEQIAEDFGLTVDEVKAALAYEWSEV